MNNLSASIYTDTFRSQRESNFSEYLATLYSSSDYTAMLEDAVTNGLANKIPLSTDKYSIQNIRLQFQANGDRVEYTFSCDAEFYIFINTNPDLRMLTLSIAHNIKSELPQDAFSDFVLFHFKSIQNQICICPTNSCLSEDILKLS